VPEPAGRRRQGLATAAAIFYASHNWQPFFTEGTQTLAFEIWEQLGFRAPDNIVVPLGYGSNILGCERGFRALMATGEVKRMPRLFGVQAENCAPFLAAQNGTSFQAKPTSPTASHRKNRCGRRRSSPRSPAAAAPWSARPKAKSPERCAGSAGTGLFVEPTSATAGVALSRLFAEGRVGRDETTIVILTGNGLKAAPVVGDLLGIE